MQQNAVAWAMHQARGETRFNEPAFDAGRALDDGTLCGHPFRSVAKSFQVRVWRDLQAAWRGLDDVDRRRIAAVLPTGGFAP